MTSLSPDQFQAYRGGHQPPKPGDDVGAPMHALNDVMPDIYSHPNAVSLYGHRDRSLNESATLRTIRSTEGKPDAPVTVHRAVPKSAGDEINPGDWVTPNKQYAVQHGESNLDGKYKVISRTVPAKELWTHGDSMHEFGWSPR